MNTFLGVDLGASNTRFVADDGKFYEVDNNVREVGINEHIRIKPYAANTYEDRVLNSLDVEIDRLNGESKYIKSKARYLVGPLATRLGASSTPNGLQNKANQRINYINAIIAVALSKLFLNADGGDTRLLIGLPPIELSNNATSEDILKKELVGTYKVSFKADIQREVMFSISEVVCLEESLLTLICFVFSPNGAYREEAKPYLTGNVLGIDIGASTTDLGRLIKGHYEEKSGKTIKIGGNFVLDIIADGIRAEYGYEPGHDELQRAVETGRLEQGAEIIDISEMLAEAKREYAIELKDKMKDYFSTMPLSSFKAVVVGGGGSMASSYVNEAGDVIETTAPMSTYLWEEFMADSNLSIPFIQVNTDPRHANIKGLFIRALVEKIAEAQKQKDAQIEAYNKSLQTGTQLKLNL